MFYFVLEGLASSRGLFWHGETCSWDWPQALVFWVGPAMLKEVSEKSTWRTLVGLEEWVFIEEMFYTWGTLWKPYSYEWEVRGRSEHHSFWLGRPESIVQSCCILPCEFRISVLDSDPSCLISGVSDKIIYVKVLALSVGRGNLLINHIYMWDDYLLSLCPSRRPPKYIRLPIPSTCDSVSLGEKGDSAHMMRLKSLTWEEEPGSSAYLWW